MDQVRKSVLDQQTFLISQRSIKVFSMFRLVKSENKPLTRELALEFKALTPSPTERELNGTRVVYLKEKVDAGLAIPFNWSKVMHKGNGNAEIRMNGQHSSTVLSSYEESVFPSNLTVHLDSYEVETDDDLALLFRQFDDRKSSRSPGDVAGAYQGLQPDLQKVPRSSAKIAVEGIGFWGKEVEGVKGYKGDDVYTIMSKPMYHPFIKWIGDLFDIKTPELKRVPIVAAMYATFDKNEEDARKFWADVARGGREYEDNHPTTVLDAWLKALKENGKAEKMKPGDYYQGCIYAYNAFFEGKTIRDIKHDWKKGLLTVKA